MDKIKFTQEELESVMDLLRGEISMNIFKQQFDAALTIAQDSTIDTITRVDAIFAYLAVRETLDSFEDKFKALYEIVEEEGE